MIHHTQEQSLLGLSFFAFSPENIHNVRYNLFYLIDWGFSYSDLVSMPLDEFYEYIELLNKHRKKENEKISEPAMVPERPKTIGEVIPGRSKL